MSGSCSMHRRQRGSPALAIVEATIQFRGAWCCVHTERERPGCAPAATRAIAAPPPPPPAPRCTQHSAAGCSPAAPAAAWHTSGEFAAPDCAQELHAAFCCCCSNSCCCCSARRSRCCHGDELAGRQTPDLLLLLLPCTCALTEGLLMVVWHLTGSLPWPILAGDCSMLDGGLLLLQLLQTNSNAASGDLDHGRTI